MSQNSDPLRDGSGAQEITFDTVPISCGTDPHAVQFQCGNGFHWATKHYFYFERTESPSDNCMCSVARRMELFPESDFERVAKVYGVPFALTVAQFFGGPQ